MDGQAFPLRNRCLCGSLDGIIRVKSGQNVVHCARCNRPGGFNAPKKETGEPRRSLGSKRDCVGLQAATAIKMRDYRCVCCGRGEPEVNLQVGHVLSVKDAREIGLSDEQINHEENLVTQCEACNNGLTSKSFTARFFLALLIRRYAPSDFSEPNGKLAFSVEWESCSKCGKVLPPNGTYDCGEHGDKSHG